MDDPEFDYTLRFGHPDREQLVFVFSASEVQRERGQSSLGLHSAVSIQAGGFTGQAQVFCDLQDFTSLLSEMESLYTTLSGTAMLQTMETQVGFTITGDGLGHISLEGFLLDRCGDGNRLEFRLDFDQTLLWHSVSDLRHLTQSSP